MAKRKTDDPAQREQLSCSFALAECHAAGDDSPDVAARFRGVASVFGQVFHAYVPSLGRNVPTIVHPGAFAKTISERPANKVKILVQHRDDLLPIGVATSLAESPEGLLVAADILNTSLGADVAKLIRAKALDELSIGATPIKYDFEEVDGEEVRNVREYMLHETSVVDAAANPGSRITEAMRRHDPEALWRELSERLADAPAEDVLRAILTPFAAEAESHAGRVLSEKNTSLVKEAISALQKLIEAAEPQAAPALTAREALMHAQLRLAEAARKRLAA